MFEFLFWKKKKNWTELSWNLHLMDLLVSCRQRKSNLNFVLLWMSWHSDLLRLKDVDRLEIHFHYIESTIDIHFSLFKTLHIKTLFGHESLLNFTFYVRNEKKILTQNYFQNFQHLWIPIRAENVNKRYIN